MNWEPYAGRLAAEAAHPVSRWRHVVATVPRHVFVPCWWAWSAPGNGPDADIWEFCDGRADPDRWLEKAYSNRSLVTQVGRLHADHAAPGDRPTGLPTSSATLPGLILRMARHTLIADGMDVLEVGTGSGYGCAVLAARAGDQHVTSIDIDPYLTSSATRRLDSIGRHPKVITCDATGPLPGTYDRITSTVAVRPIPASWLTALRPGGRLVTTITGTNLIVTADKTPDGGATGVTEWDRAGFMPTRVSMACAPGMHERFNAIRDADGEQVSTGRYPVIDVAEAWELNSALGITIPGGVSHHYTETPDGKRTAWMLAPDGSWARATSTRDDPPTVHQSGPHQLWDTLDRLRHSWLRDGSLPAYGAKVTIGPDGSICLKRGHWQEVIPAT